MTSFEGHKERERKRETGYFLCEGTESSSLCFFCSKTFLLKVETKSVCLDARLGVRLPVSLWVFKMWPLLRQTPTCLE